MVRNKLSDLTNTLFAQLETLDDRDLTAEELKSRAPAFEADGCDFWPNLAGWPTGLGR